MKIGKRSYAGANRKRQVRDESIPQHKYTTLVTMLGPTPIAAYMEAKSKGFKKIISVEIDRETYEMQVQQCSQLNDPNLILKFGSFLDVPIKHKTFFDGDFCGNITSFVAELQKFKKNCSFTFGMRNSRGMTKPDIIDFFFAVRGETDVVIVPLNRTKTNYFITSSAGEYSVKTYKDCMAMINFTKTK